LVERGEAAGRADRQHGERDLERGGEARAEVAAEGGVCGGPPRAQAREEPGDRQQRRQARAAARYPVGMVHTCGAHAQVRGDRPRAQPPPIAVGDPLTDLLAAEVAAVLRLGQCNPGVRHGAARGGRRRPGERGDPLVVEPVDGP
jgi:hypothetical protein